MGRAGTGGRRHCLSKPQLVLSPPHPIPRPHWGGTALGGLVSQAELPYLPPHRQTFPFAWDWGDWQRRTETLDVFTDDGDGGWGDGDGRLRHLHHGQDWKPHDGDGSFS